MMEREKREKIMGVCMERNCTDTYKKHTRITGDVVVEKANCLYLKDK